MEIMVALVAVAATAVKREGLETLLTHPLLRVIMAAQAIHLG
jgi:hypothetical protein